MDQGSVCGNCLYCGEVGRVRECRRRPPALMSMAVAGPGVVGGPPAIRWITNSVYPPVSAKTPACGEFQAKAEIVN